MQEVLEAEVSVLALPEVVVDLAQLAVPAQLAVLVSLAVLVPLQLEAELAVEEALVEALHRSFSSAMVGDLPSAGTPPYSPVPRSGRKAKPRP